MYTRYLETPWVIPKDETAITENMSQAVFHAIFGSYAEDFSLLQWMTDTQKWLTRKEMGQFKEGFGSSHDMVQVRLPKIKYYSKLISSNISGLLTEQTD